MNPLLAARKELGWTQVRLAARLGLSQPEIARMEAGDKPLDSKALAFVAGEGPTTTRPSRTRKARTKSLGEIDINKPAKLNRLQTANLRKMPTAGCRVQTWEKWWFSVTNPVCVTCVRTCKQSAMVKVICCPARQTSEDEDE